MEMCVSSRQMISTAASTSYAAGFHAKTSLLPETERALTESARAYGQKCGDFLATFDPLSSSWKTRQACLISGWEEFSETWPSSGMMLSGTAFRLPPLAPLTNETAFGLLPTIVKSDGASARSVTSNTRAKSYRTSTGSWRYRAAGAESSNLMLTRSLILELEYLTTPGSELLILDRRFAENLMGFPINWTQLAPSGTRSSRKFRS